MTATHSSCVANIISNSQPAMQVLVEQERPEKRCTTTTLKLQATRYTYSMKSSTWCALDKPATLTRQHTHNTRTHYSHLGKHTLSPSAWPALVLHAALQSLELQTPAPSKHLHSYTRQTPPYTPPAHQPQTTRMIACVATHPAYMCAQTCITAQGAQSHSHHSTETWLLQTVRWQQQDCLSA